jgi:putative oxidoreductase
MLKEINTKIERVLNSFQDLGLLIARVLMAYGFFMPAFNKWSNIGGVAEWFGTLGIPFPLLNTYMAATTEMAGVVLLTLGLFTRYISFPLIVVMIVAIVTVHLPNGFSAGDNGFEIPVYYMVFLFLFLSHGAGKYSIDYFIFKKTQ